MKSKTWKESLYCTLGEAERDRLGREAATLAVRYAELEEASKASAKTAREDLKELREKMDAAEESHTGIGRRPVEVYEVPEYGAGIAGILRRDTGDRIRVRDMEADERQLGLLPGLRSGGWEEGAGDAEEASR